MSFASARKNAGFSQAEAARRLGVDASTVCSWEIGRQSPRAGMLVEMADLYCCSIDQLMDRKVSRDSA